MLGPKSRIAGFPPEKAIVLDTETTGVGTDDEIIQISAVDGFGRECLNLFIKPTRKAEWPEAQRIHGISPEDVAACRTMDELRPKLQRFLDQFSCIVGYNIPFDIRMLGQAGLDISHMEAVDVMPMYVKHFGVMRRGRKTAKLVEAAEHYGYTFGAHDSLEDVKATLVVLENLMREKRCS